MSASPSRAQMCPSAFPIACCSLSATEPLHSPTNQSTAYLSIAQTTSEQIPTTATADVNYQSLCHNLTKHKQYYFFMWRHQPTTAKADSMLGFRVHTQTHHTHTQHNSSGRVTSSSQRSLPDNTQHSQQTDIRAPGGIRTHDLSRRVAADLRPRPRCHWDLQLTTTHQSVGLLWTSHQLVAETST